ncbi:CMGC/CDK protein kinase [Plasmodium inui San Antonio 1]|uniref:non-specific serine/threonine protein kinase n=1 Tax=Plasmodium inui San Antonio 1 TaxID=1237626 RepID=W7APJ8_9APIC|nr:CMGC/CDK protein kinase [Plasmodium inui San Antonio 1]EUD67336.1 CMGC/CDK protein kinase [Plasmodium inui San Antonio 1]
MDRVTSKRVKNNVLIEKSGDSEKKALNRRRTNMNKKKNVLLNDESKNDEAIKKNLKRVKNEKISKNAKDKLETTCLINTRSRENDKKDTIYKGIEKEKKYPHASRVTSIKSNNASANHGGENRLGDGKNDNVKSSNYTILNYFKSKSATDKYGSKASGRGNSKVANDSKARNGSNNRADYSASNSAPNQAVSQTISQAANQTTNQTITCYANGANQTNYLKMKNNIEHNLMNYKKCKLNQMHAENFSMDSYRSNNSSNSELYIGSEQNNLYASNQEHTIGRSSMQLKESRLRSSIGRAGGLHSSLKSGNMLDLRSNILKGPLQLSDLYSSRNGDSSTVLTRNSLYKCKEERVDGLDRANRLDRLDGVDRADRGEKGCCASGAENRFIMSRSLGTGLNGLRGKTISHVEGSRGGIGATDLMVNGEGRRSEAGYRGTDMRRSGDQLYSYKDRNKDYLDSINLSINRESEKARELLGRSLPSRNTMNSTKLDEEYFSNNILNFENYCSDRFKRRINNNLINNICSMYEDKSNLEDFISRKRREGGVCKSKEDFAKYRMDDSCMVGIRNDHFEGEQLFKRPRMSLYNSLLRKSRFEGGKKVEKNDRDSISELLLHHQDLLINKREKIVVSKDVEDTKDIIVKKYIKNFWLLSRKDFFSKYWNASLELSSIEVEKMKELISLPPNEPCTIDDLFSKDNEIVDEDQLVKDYVTDEKLRNFRLDLIDGFLYDKQSLYEREMVENEKIFSHISFNHKNSDIKVDKLLNLFPRDFMRKYKIVKKLGEGVYGKVFKAESLEDSYLHFAVKVLRYFWPNFKYKFGSEEFAINEFNIMRILFHPNVVCLLDSFRVHTYRKSKVKTHRNQKTRNETVSAEYDFSFQRHRKVERNQHSPSRDTIERNNKYKNLISKGCITIEDLEKDLVMYNIDKEESLNGDPKLGSHLNRTVKSLRSYHTEGGSEYGSTNVRKDIHKDRSNDRISDQSGNLSNERSSDLAVLHAKKKVRTATFNSSAMAHPSELQRMKMSRTSKMNRTKKMSMASMAKMTSMASRTNKSIDKLKFRKHSRKLKKIENKNNDYIENWDLFLVIEKCDCSLNDILSKAKKRHTSFIQHIKQCTAQHLPSERIDMSYDHIHNYVKYVYLPLKKIENRSFYPDMPSLSEIQTKVIIYQMLQGINHFHKKFVIHRDIKPANTLIKNIKYLSDGLNDSKEWIVKIADFGLGVYDHFLKAETKDCNIITLQYRPPEILCNSTMYNYSVDIWSIGITMCECLLGFVPVTSKFESSVLFKILVFRGIPDDDFGNLLKKEFVGELPQFKVDRLRMLEVIFTDIYGRRLLSDHGIDLIDQFLSYDYKNRITANDALKHPWFEDVHLYLNERLLRYYKRTGTYYF